MFQAWTLSIVERVARKAACPAHGDTLRVHASSESQGGGSGGQVALSLRGKAASNSKLHWCNQDS